MDSVLAQTFSEWECIVVNDGSVDKSSEIAENYALKDARFRVINQQNSGVASARNKGISISQGEYILPLDADDKIGPTYVEKAINYLETNPNCKVVYCEARKFGAENTKWNLDEYSYEGLKWHGCIFDSAVFRRRDFDRTSGYNTNLRGYEDWELWLSMLNADDEVHQIKEELFFYRTKDGSRSCTADLVCRELYAEIQKLHPELYVDLQANALYNYMQLQYTIAELQAIRESLPYRIGELIAWPYRKFKRKRMKRKYE